METKDNNELKIKEVKTSLNINGKDYDFRFIDLGDIVKDDELVCNHCPLLKEHGINCEDYKDPRQHLDSSFYKDYSLNDFCLSVDSIICSSAPEIGIEKLVLNPDDYLNFLKDFKGEEKIEKIG